MAAAVAAVAHFGAGPLSVSSSVSREPAIAQQRLWTRSLLNKTKHPLDIFFFIFGIVCLIFSSRLVDSVGYFCRPTGYLQSRRTKIFYCNQPPPYIAPAGCLHQPSLIISRLSSVFASISRVEDKMKKRARLTTFARFHHRLHDISRSD